MTAGPAAVADSLRFGNFLRMSGNGGNTAVQNFENTFISTFEAAAPTPTVPEPASLAPLGMGRAFFVTRRR